MTLNDLMTILRDNGLHGASVGEDNDGQIVIYTDKKLDRNETLVPFEAVEVQ